GPAEADEIVTVGPGVSQHGAPACCPGWPAAGRAAAGSGARGASAGCGTRASASRGVPVLRARQVMAMGALEAGAAPLVTRQVAVMGMLTGLPARQAGLVGARWRNCGFSGCRPDAAGTQAEPGGAVSAGRGRYLLEGLTRMPLVARRSALQPFGLFVLV